MDKIIDIKEIETNNWQKKFDTIGEIVTENEDIEQCFNTILNTVKGECPLQPNIGSNLFDAIGENPQNASQIIKTIIYKEFPVQEPRAKILDVKISSDEDNIFKMIVEIQWQNIRTKEEKLSKYKIWG